MKASEVKSQCMFASYSECLKKKKKQYEQCKKQQVLCDLLFPASLGVLEMLIGRAMLWGLPDSPDGDDSATSRRDGDSQKHSKTGRARGEAGRDPSKMPVSCGIHFSSMHGNIRKASCAARVVVVAEVPNTPLWIYTTACPWASPAGIEMPLEGKILAANPQIVPSDISHSIIGQPQSRALPPPKTKEHEGWRGRNWTRWFPEAPSISSACDSVKMEYECCEVLILPLDSDAFKGCLLNLACIWQAKGQQGI